MTEIQLEEALWAHQDALYHLALRLSRSEEDAKDLVQTAYLRALRSLSQVRDKGALKAWLFRILVHLYIDRYRRQRLEPHAMNIEEVETLLPAPSQSPRSPPTSENWEEYLKQHLSDAVKRAVESLPPPYRLTVLLRDAEGFSYGEIAEMLRIPVGTVMSRLFRARRLIRERLLWIVE